MEAKQLALDAMTFNFPAAVRQPANVAANDGVIPGLFNARPLSCLLLDVDGVSFFLAFNGSAPFLRFPAIRENPGKAQASRSHVYIMTDAAFPAAASGMSPAAAARSQAPIRSCGSRSSNCFTQAAASSRRPMAAHWWPKR